LSSLTDAEVEIQDLSSESDSQLEVFRPSAKSLKRTISTKSSGISHRWSKEENEVINSSFKPFITCGEFNQSPRPNTNRLRSIMEKEEFPTLVNLSTPTKVKLLRTKVYNSKRLFTEKQSRQLKKSLD
jgi:hypothetical protein